MKSPPYLVSVKEQFTSCRGENSSDVEDEIAQEPQTYTIEEEEVSPRRNLVRSSSIEFQCRHLRRMGIL